MTEHPPQAPRADLRSWVIARREDLVVLAALAYWATGLVWGTGGRQPHRLTIALVLVAAAALVVRPWQRLPLRALIAIQGVSVSALLVALVTPTGLDGANEASSWVLASQLGLVVAAWAVTIERRKLVLGVVVVAAGMELMKGLTAWWGGGTPDRVFVGTFFWHNQAGIFMAVGAVVALGALTLRIRGVELAGWVVFPLCAAGTRLTTSRGSQIALGLGALAVLALALSVRGTRRTGPLRWIAAGALSYAAFRTLTSSLLFTRYTGTLPASRDQSVGTNAQHRLDFWHDAVNNFLHWPLAGTGFHGFLAGSRLTDPDRAKAYSAYAHNGFLQVLSDGGILFALPVLLLIGAALVVGARAARSHELTDPTRVLALVAAIALLLHVGMDFDWAYPALVALTALLLGVAAAPSSGPLEPITRPRAVLALITLSSLALAALAGWHGILHANVPVGVSG